MKKILFPATFRGHIARQQLLIKELKKSFEVDIWEPTTPKEGSMSVSSIMIAIEFNNYLSDKDYDCILLRGDRYEMLGLAMVASYRGIPIMHLEGGDLSGAIDNKVRHAVTQLSDYHFVTNEESHRRLIQSGILIDRVWNFGSLDVEYAQTIETESLRQKKYIMVAFHPIEGEDENEVSRAIRYFGGYDIIGIASNKDYGRQYGTENYSPEEYITLMRYASCLVGNSSSFLKEASILAVPVVNVGSRQDKRLKPKNVMDIPCEEEKIKQAIEFQLRSKYKQDFTYYKDSTSIHIAEKLKEVI